MAADASGNVYVIGDTNLSENSFRAFSAFISKFSPTGSLLYTYHPDNSSCGDPGDTALAIALNASGTQAYVAGISNDTLFGCIQTTPGAYKSAADVSGGIWSIKLDISHASGASLVYGTYIGPDPNVSRFALAVSLPIPKATLTSPVGLTIKLPGRLLRGHTEQRFKVDRSMPLSLN